MLLYGRSDTRRRRLLNLTVHLAELHQRFGETHSVVLWDDEWKKRPPIARQAELIRHAEVLVTPHGAWPSVWGLFLRPGAAVVEVFSSCMTSTWLPRHVLKELGVKHLVLNRNLGDARILVDARSGARVKGCVQWPNDPDIFIDPPAELARRVFKFLR